MTILASEQTDIDKAVTKALRDVSRANLFSLKAGLRILMTTDVATFEQICSYSVQQNLSDFVKFLTHPEELAPMTSQDEIGRTEVIGLIKQCTLNNLFLLDNRTAILPNTHMVKKSIMEKERLKSVVHASALRNVLTNAHYMDQLTKRFKEEGIPVNEIETRVNKAIESIQELHKAVMDGNISQILSALAVHGVDVNYPNEQGMTPLHLAARGGLSETVKLLLTVPNIQVNLVDNNGWTALHIAARMGYADVVDALLTMANINPNAVNSDGWSPLHWAAWHGFNEVVTVLLTAPGIKVNILDQNLTSPLHLAARNGHPDIISILLSAPDLDMNLLDNEKRTPLHLATIYNHTEAVQALLLSPKIEINIADMDGLSPLHWAARNGHIPILNDLLIHRDTLIDVVDNNGMSPLDWAMRNGHIPVIKILKPYFNSNQSKPFAIKKLFSVFKKQPSSSKER